MSGYGHENSQYYGSCRKCQNDRDQVQGQGQGQGQGQLQGQLQGQVDKLANIGNPTINIGTDNGFNTSTRASAFRAVSTESVSVEANEEIKVFYQDQQFDLRGEYRPNNSVFIPKRDGVYLVQGQISFAPENNETNYRARVEIRINGNPYEAADNDFWGTGVANLNAVQVSSILQLEAGDRVEIFMESSIAGALAAYNPGSSTPFFAAARFPSPDR
ncbi:ABC transporter permease [Halobacillus massiliensis]|uniref:ABC transporter permease n=1 Tax=Halobacillus massiliensis TaxID=1926286 RepID=UPI001FE8DF2F|nr:ABC transporter permease [Halobacillus massiliensis]